jgi:hypothetical protein
VVSAVGYYFSNRQETRAKVKGRDVLVLRYRAVKNWSFDPSKLVVGGYSLTSGDVLTSNERWESELPPGGFGVIAVAVPSLKPGKTLEMRFEDAAASFDVPRGR